jgi:hypothetical protein
MQMIRTRGTGKEGLVALRPMLTAPYGSSYESGTFSSPTMRSGWAWDENTPSRSLVTSSTLAKSGVLDGNGLPHRAGTVQPGEYLLGIRREPEGESRRDRSSEDVTPLPTKNDVQGAGCSRDKVGKIAAKDFTSAAGPDGAEVKAKQYAA